ncbi:MAG: nitric oxide reductase activation protein NorD [Oscillospiraceae bacterium]|nr:nitric oxide reductase activation protein NorD [Oscillospiraceae bacterium]
MSRVNHKRVKQLLNEKRSKITDRQFFSSRILAGHYEDLAAAQTRRYHYNRRIRVNLYWNAKDSTAACTDNTNIIINTGNPVVTKVRGRANRYQIVTGMFAHELGHVLFTDFLALQTYHNSLAMYRWYPAPPALYGADLRRERDFWDYVKAEDKNLEMVQTVAHHIGNALEDGYIENRMLNAFPGTLGYGLEELRKDQENHMATVTQLIEWEESGEHHKFESLLQLILSYAKFGTIKYGDEPMSDERIQTVFGLMDDIDRALLTHSAKERLRVVSLILIRCWDTIRDFCELCKERQEEAEASGGGSLSPAQTLSQILQSIAGSSHIGSGNSAPVPDSDSETESSATESSRASTRQDAEESNPPEEEEEAGVKKVEEESEQEGEAESGSTPEEGSSEPASPPPMPNFGSYGGDSAGNSGKQEASEEEKGRIPLQQTDRCSNPLGGSTERNEEYVRQKNEKAASDIERILDKMAERAACETLESERLQELNDAAQSISYGNIHEGVSIRVNRVASVDEELVEQYDQISAPLLTISRQLQRSLVRQLKEHRQGGKQNGLLMGRRLDSHALHRTDGKIFCKNNLPNELPELAVGLLLDESGSMCSRDRCTYARASAIILYDFCKSLDIPVMVYGHSTGYSDSRSTVELYSYAEFDDFDRDDKYRMMDISARGSNRDGAALRYVAEQLSRRPEAIKLLILVSDGQPADTGYYGTAAEEDLRGIKQEYTRKHILFVAAAIGDDKPSIERIYGDSFLDITDLNQLPVKLTNLVKRHVRV